ncbi:WD40-repeat-containing domain protein [Hyaloraphidium curvatum]|nr:WD40-repeat-containing domain protein [Hyaloraphidium curvatum]
MAGPGADGAREPAVAQDRQVRVEFVTKHEQYRIPETGMLLPASLKRYGLSEIVNHVLARETPVPFDFLVDGQFLRTSLLEHVTSNALSLETTVVLEYLPSARPPSEIGGFPHPDWVSSVSGNSSSQVILTGCYDGSARVWNKSGACVATLAAGKDPVKAVGWWFPRDGTSHEHCLTGGSDQRITAWKLDERWMPSVSFTCVGHASSVDALAVSMDSRHFASASFDGTVKLWTTSTDDLDQVQTDDGARPSKRRRGDAESDVPVKAPLRSFEGHSAGVSCVCFDGTADGRALLSGSMDHSIRRWDMETGINTRTMTSDKAVNAIDVSKVAGLIVTGHSDRVARIWDARVSDGNAVKLKFSGHQGWISAVKWSASNDYAFATASYDSLVKIWDIRSDSALFSTPAQDAGNKVLDMDWVDNLILAGGSDSSLHVLAYDGSSK